MNTWQYLGPYTAPGDIAEDGILNRTARWSNLSCVSGPERLDSAGHRAMRTRNVKNQNLESLTVAWFSLCIDLQRSDQVMSRWAESLETWLDMDG